MRNLYFLIVLLWQTAANAHPAVPYPAGLSDNRIEIDGAARRYLVHVPEKFVASPPRAIVFVLHGGGGLGVGIAPYGAHPLSVFRNVADRENFVVVYPEGSFGRDGSTGWNDCRADNRLAGPEDDVRFLATVIAKVRDEYHMPQSRVFLAGGSNGGLMTFAMALHRPELMAAIAVSSANLPKNPLPGPCAEEPKMALPALLTHGTADPQMPYDGGCVANMGGACNRGTVVSAEETLNRWLQRDGLTGAGPTEQVVDTDPDDAGPANRFDYTGPAPVQWWRLDGAGHTVASRLVRVRPSEATGRQNNDIEFAEVAWAFFRSLLPCDPDAKDSLDRSR